MFLLVLRLRNVAACCSLLFQAGLSGLSFDEGTFGVFGYVTSGMDSVAKLQTGDVIRSAKLISGRERLVVPQAPEQQGVAAAPAAGSSS